MGKVFYKSKKGAKMKKKKVIISLNSGLIDTVKIPKGVKLEIRDYDIAGDVGEVRNDNTGLGYVRTVFTKKDALINK